MVKFNLERAGIQYETGEGVADFHASGWYSLQQGFPKASECAVGYLEDTPENHRRIVPGRGVNIGQFAAVGLLELVAAVQSNYRSVLSQQAVPEHVGFPENARLSGLRAAIARRFRSKPFLSPSDSFFSCSGTVNRVT
jgi:hypothetical protein